MFDPAYLSIAERLALLLALAALVAWGLVSCDIADALGWPDQEPEPLPQPKGGLGRRLEGDPARVLANYRLIGREWIVSRMRPCDDVVTHAPHVGDER